LLTISKRNAFGDRLGGRQAAYERYHELKVLAGLLRVRILQVVLEVNLVLFEEMLQDVD
jgi:hypothetical protein